MSSPFFIFLFILIMMVLFAFGFKLFCYMTRKPLKRDKQTGKAGDPGACPVCGVALKGGQKIKSMLFSGKGDKICHIYGCPSCLSPESPLAAMRVCPVCKTRLGTNDYLIARVFERGKRRRHVHILGCVYCRMR